jgi:hypothetical protein
MPHNDSDNLAQESTYPQLELPEFESTIPSHLLHGVSRENQFVMENINIQTQYIKWLCEAAIDTNQQVRKTNGRLKKVETWKDKISSMWVTVAALFTFLSTAALLAVKFYKSVFTDQGISIF